jgi:hypothetical protein
MSKVYVDIEANLGRAGKQQGTVTIDRRSRTISVRPKHGREEFMLPLEDIAEYIAHTVLKTKAMEAKPVRRPRRRMVSRGLLTTGR